MIPNNKSPAEIASDEALTKLYKAIDDNQSFRLEAGAGAGKTYSLIKVLQYLIDKKETSFLRKNQKIACITYTNTAKEEIEDRVDNNSIIYADTIHAFSWSFLSGFQKSIREFIPFISQKWESRIEEAGGLNNQVVKYDLGYPRATDSEILLHHDDVIKIMVHLLSKEKFKSLLIDRFPIILIDEYQDTNTDLADSIVSQLIDSDYDIMIGLFGDHWQKIYGSNACGLIENENIIEIGKNANFRSEKNIVHALNRMRPELPQNEKHPHSEGEITIFHTNNFTGTRRAGSHWNGDLPIEKSKTSVQKVKQILTENDWEFDSENTKILMLTNNVLAEEQGYINLASVFRDSDDYLKMNDHYIKFFIDVLEPVCRAFENKKYGEMFSVLNSNTPKLTNQNDKSSWNSNLNQLIEVRKTGTIGEILKLLKTTTRPRLSPKVEERESKFVRIKLLDVVSEEEESFISKIEKLKSINYQDVLNLFNYLSKNTPFSTKHGVKGKEFNNALIIAGRGWNHYNWDQFLTWHNTAIPSGKQSAYERNRNLFYVCCSRPKKRLAILFTQELSTNSFETLSNWFGEENLYPLS
jgi:DNA helicase-2/ATP-dependent DNA helicase PcrA